MLSLEPTAPAGVRTAATPRWRWRGVWRAKLWQPMDQARSGLAAPVTFRASRVVRGPFRRVRDPDHPWGPSSPTRGTIAEASAAPAEPHMHL